MEIVDCKSKGKVLWVKNKVRDDVYFCNQSMYNRIGHYLRKAGNYEPNDII
jgi:hypothetical protein